MTGKTSYVNHELKESVAMTWNLLDGRLRLRALSDPSILKEEIEARGLDNCIVVIDEIQKAPELLNEIHNLIEEKNISFLLTGSSACKLREAGVNLAGQIKMHPFVFTEIEGLNPSLEMIFSRGLLPSGFCSDDPEQELNDYVGTYLTEEITQEGTTRNLPAFSRFLEVAALANTQILHYQNIANDVGVNIKTVQSWFDILKDTLIGYELPTYQKAKKRKTFQTSKFYFFDVGVARILKGINPPTSNQTEYGEFFEHFIFMELRAYLDYNQKKEGLSYWRTTSGFEVDFILGDTIAIETKTTKKVDSRDLKGLLAFKEENICTKYILVCCEERPRLLENGIYIMPWKWFLNELWNDKLI